MFNDKLHCSMRYLMKVMMVYYNMLVSLLDRDLKQVKVISSFTCTMGLTTVCRVSAIDCSWLRLVATKLKPRKS